MRPSIPRASALAAALALSIGAAAAAGLKAPELKLTINQTPNPAAAGQPMTIQVKVEPPPGIKLNQYPGITLKITSTGGLKLDKDEAFVGTKTPIEDPAKFGFTKIDPLELRATAPAGATGAKTLEGTLKYFYCVKASDYCAPGTMKVTIPVKLK